MTKKLKQEYLIKMIERHGSVPNVAKFTNIHRRTIENWKYGITEMPDHTFRYLCMLEDKRVFEHDIYDRLFHLKEWIYSDNSICKEDKECLDYELSYIMTILRGAHDITK